MRMSRRRSGSFVLAVLISCGAFLASSAEPASADNYVDCAAANDHNFDGFYSTGSGTLVEGAAARLITSFGNICTDSSGRFNPPGTLNAIGENLTSGWVMIAGHNPSSGGVGYIQSGFDREYGRNPIFFSEDNLTGAPSVYRRRILPGGGPVFGDAHMYWEQFTTVAGGTCAGGQYRENVDVTIIQIANFCPFASWATPYLPEFSGEGLNLNDDIPGSPSAPMVFYTLQTQDFVTDAFTNYLPSMNWASASGESAYNYNPHTISYSGAIGWNFSVYTITPHHT
jgi:hypothetical protein